MKRRESGAPARSERLPEAPEARARASPIADSSFGAAELRVTSECARARGSSVALGLSKHPAEPLVAVMVVAVPQLQVNEDVDS
jgi:hypothetical protein